MPGEVIEWPDLGRLEGVLHGTEGKERPFHRLDSPQGGADRGGRTLLQRLARASLAVALLALPAATEAENRVFLQGVDNSEQTVFDGGGLPAVVPNAGAEAAFDLVAAFDDETVGGGIVLAYDALAVTFLRITFNDGPATPVPGPGFTAPALGDDRDFRCRELTPSADVVDCPASTADRRFLSFGGLDSISGTRTIGRIFFDVLPGSSPSEITLSATPETTPPGSPFSDVEGNMLAVRLEGASIGRLDSDLDGAFDDEDNCRTDANADQSDVNATEDDDSSLAGSQSYGDACDVDLDDDGVVGPSDFFVVFRPCLNETVAGTPACALADLDGDGLVAASDFFARFRPALGTKPGLGLTE